MRILAIMPARSGSKGIKNKNLTKLNGKPLVFYTLKILRGLKNFVYPFISTDSKLILNYSKKFGYNQTYLRPKKLSLDKSNVVDAVLHSIKWLEHKKLHFDYVLLLEPTSPIRNLKKLIKIINKVLEQDIETSASISKLPFHPNETIFKKNKKWKFVKKSKKNVYQRQNFDQNYFFIDGCFYLCKINFLKKHKKFILENKTHLFLNDISYPVDINNHIDLKIAEVIMKYEKR